MSSSNINIFLQHGVIMTEQELDQIIVYGIPDTTRRQAEVLVGQLNVHLELLKIKESKQEQQPRHPPLAPMSPFNEWGGG
jgi:hypothetical protein